MTDLADWMKGIREQVDGRLDAYFSDKIAEAKALSPDSVELVEGVRSLTMRGGKRFRPMMVEGGFRAIDPKGPADATTSAGASLEVLQSYLLIHDDWMDQDDERRGGPAVHVMYRNRYEQHMANSLAVLAGDLASAYSLELLMSSAGVNTDVLRVFLQIQKEVFFGQHLDITQNAEVSRMHDLKTTSYTVRGPLLLGATLAGADAAQIEALTAYANPLGEAFQLADDLLGTFGNQGDTGKPGNDLLHRKRTSLVAEAERLLPAGQRDALDAVMDGQTSDENLAAASELLVTSGARANIEKRLHDRSEEAKAALASASIDEGGKTILSGLADRLAHRAY